MGLYYADGKGNAIKISSNAGKWLPASWTGASGDAYYMDTGAGDIFFKGQIVIAGNSTSIGVSGHSGLKLVTPGDFIPDDNTSDIVNAALNGNTLTVNTTLSQMTVQTACLQLSYTK